MRAMRNARSALATPGSIGNERSDIFHPDSQASLRGSRRYSPFVQFTLPLHAKVIPVPSINYLPSTGVAAVRSAGNQQLGPLGTEA